MNSEPARVVVAAFTSIHEAALAKSVLEAAGIDTTLADEHVVSMTWTYSNAVGGVKVLVPEDRLEEARSLLAQDAVALEQDAIPAGAADDADDIAEDVCRHCGSRDFESRLPGKGLAILSWLTIGVPLGSPLRRRYCRQCGAAAKA